ncbi:phage tail fiber protein [Streptomyces hirsutus]|uniref:phage tail fiber protein n=1 Tax=Streptomyces hirsutus TaxID=35620 RepID=UPI003697529A
MPDSLSNTAENLTLDWVLGVGTPTRPTMPLKVALVTANGTDTTSGTEVAGGSYARQNLAVAAAVNGATSNSADLVWTGMPAVTVTGVEVWDSAGTPVRIWHGPIVAPGTSTPTPRTVAAGDEFRLPAGALALSMA